MAAPVRRSKASGDASTTAKTGAPNTAARKTAARKTAALKTAALKVAARKTAALKVAARKTAALKSAGRKTAASKVAVQKTAAQKTAGPNTAAPRTAGPNTAAPKVAAPNTAVTKAAVTKAARPRTSADISAVEARRIVLTAQGFAGRPARAAAGDVLRVIGRVVLIQVDSVNVVCRSQELPLWARIGAHARDTIPSLCQRGVLFEYWAHEASLLPVELQPLLRWRMAEARSHAWGILRRFARRDPGYIERVRAEVHARGRVLARDLEPTTQRRKRAASWWSWDDRKRALAYLFWAGEITAIRSATTFERVYAPLERVIPAAVLATPTPSPDDARRELLVRSARALGVATARDLADYFRIKIPIARPLIAALVEARRLVPVTVEGWREPGYRHPEAPPSPREPDGCALVSPFDSLVWERQRTERLFGFRYRIEIYTPAHKRVHGYYVVPVLLGDALVARVDLKADRAAGALLVQAAFAEPGAPAATPRALADELTAFARWLGLDRVVVGERGDLCRTLRACLA